MSRPSRFLVPTSGVALLSLLALAGCQTGEEPDEDAQSTIDGSSSSIAMDPDEARTASSDDLASVERPEGLVFAGKTASCKKTIYVHIIAYGYTDYSYIYNNKNSCWGLETPKWTSGSSWSICNWNATNPSGATKWAYDDVNIGASGHSDATDISDCKSKNGNVTGTVYVAANSGSSNNWSHSGISGASKYLNECYDSDTKVNNRTTGCTTNGSPMWNIGASTAVSTDVKNLCNSRKSGQWLGIYASTVGLSGKEASIVSALNACTTQ